MPDEIKEHLRWVMGYCEVANEANWRDILDRVQSQIRMAQQDAATL